MLTQEQLDQIHQESARKVRACAREEVRWLARRGIGFRMLGLGDELAESQAVDALLATARRQEDK